jgi:hypothetical protein
MKVQGGERGDAGHVSLILPSEGVVSIRCLLPAFQCLGLLSLMVRRKPAFSIQT